MARRAAAFALCYLARAAAAPGAAWDGGARGARYCAAAPAPARAEGAAPAPPGGGAAAPGAPAYALAHAAVIVRHGDRSAIGRLPGAARGVFPCGEPSAAAVARTAAALRPFRSSAACVLAGGVGAACAGPFAGAALTNGTDRALRAWGVARAPGDACGAAGGELSSAGWAQLRATGALLARAYAPLLLGDDGDAGGGAGGDEPPPADVPLHVVSTDTGRTALSAAAFVDGLVAELAVELAARAGGGAGGAGGAGAGARGARGAPPEATSEAASSGASASVTAAGGVAADDGAAAAAAAAAAGAALFPRGPLALHILPREEDPMLWPKKAYVCARAGVLQHRAFDAIFAHQVMEPGVAARVAALSNTSLSAMPTTEECADDVSTRACHGHALPCWPPPPGAPPGAPPRCLAPEDAAAIVARCDEGYAFRYDNEVTRLLAFPVLRQLTAQMERADARARALRAGGGAGGGAAGGGAAAAAAVAAALGDDGAVPRLQFRAGHDTVIAPLLAALGATDAPHAWPSYAARLGFEVWVPRGAGAGAGAGEAAGEAAPALVKVLYNGENWTPRLACAAGAGACTLPAFAAQVRALIAPHATWDAACFTDEPHVVHAGDAAHPTRGGASDVGPGAADAPADAAAPGAPPPQADDGGNDVGPGRPVDDAPAGAQ
jgi:hypothetical protein